MKWEGTPINNNNKKVCFFYILSKLFEKTLIANKLFITLSLSIYLNVKSVQVKKFVNLTLDEKTASIIAEICTG